MKVVSINEVSIEEIADVIKNSGVVILPFDTCYGLVCNPSDQKAVDKLLAYKARREGKAISVTVLDEKMAEQYVDINDTARSIYERFLPGPYTVISTSKNNVAHGVAAENATLGVRIIDSDLISKLLTVLDHAITSTSANQSYQKTPYKISDILDTAPQKIHELIDLIVDAGELEHNPPSTVMDTTLGEIQVVRKGKFLPDGSVISEVETYSEEETVSFGTKLMEKFKTNLEYRPVIFALQGDLGAGKTQFTKGVALELGIEEQVISPTFILTREYESKSGHMLYHMDTWRLEKEQDLYELGVDKMLKSHIPPVFSIEWADKVLNFLNALDINHKIIWVEIKSGFDNPQKRIIRWCE